MPEKDQGESCPHCGEPYSKQVEGRPVAMINHLKAKQARTCIQATREGLRITYHHYQDLIGGDALSDDERYVLDRVRDVLHESDEPRAKRAEVAGRCLDRGLGPDEVNALLEDLVQRGLIEEPDDGLFAISEALDA